MHKYSRNSTNAKEKKKKERKKKKQAFTKHSSSLSSCKRLMKDRTSNQFTKWDKKKDKVNALPTLVPTVDNQGILFSEKINPSVPHFLWRFSFTVRYSEFFLACWNNTLSYILVCWWRAYCCLWDTALALFDWFQYCAKSSLGFLIHKRPP